MNIIILDTETEGLDEKRHAVLELAMLAVEVPTFEIVAEFSQCVRILQVPTTIDPYVRKMHQDSGLWDDCLRSPHSLVEVENAACAFVDAHTHGDSPLGGANPAFDRRFLVAQLPLLARRFHYRNLDVRTLTYLDEWIVGAPKEAPAHRALGDCRQAVRAVELHYERMAEAYRR